MNQIIFSKVRKQPVKKAPEALLEKMGVEVNVKRNGAFVIDQDSIKLVEFNDETGEVRITLREAPLAYMDTPQPEEEAPVEQPKEGANPFTHIQPFHKGFMAGKITGHTFIEPIKSNSGTHYPSSDYPSLMRNTEVEKALVKSLINGPQGLSGLANYSVASDLEKTARLYEELIETLCEGPKSTGVAFNEELTRAILLYNHFVLNYQSLFGSFTTISENEGITHILKLIKLLKEVLNLIKIYKDQL